MGCHTWVYANRKPYDKVAVHNKATELYKKEKQHWKFIKETYLGMSESTALRLLAEYKKYFDEADALPIGKERIQKFDSGRKEFGLKFGSKTLDYISYVWYMVVDYGYNLDNYTTRMREHISKVDQANQKYHAHKSEFIYNAVKDLYIHDDTLLEILRKESQYALKTEYHDPFRVYGYPDVVLKSKSEVLDYVRSDVPNHMTCDGFTKLDNPDEFITAVESKLDIIYTKYPDAVITFG